MTEISNIALMETLGRTKLLAPEHLKSVYKRKNWRYADARSLAEYLVRKRWLTKYQMEQLLIGNGKDLVVGPYHIVDRLGKGGQSTVYKAYHTEMEWLVALKLFPAELLSDPAVLRQFIKEMEATASLEHPNIVQFYDADRTEDYFYCALEFVEGTDLGKYVQTHGPLPVSEACSYVRQTALGLQHAYERNLIHRDIKPENLCLMSPSGSSIDLKSLTDAGGSILKILDWGLASVSAPKRSSSDHGAADGSMKALLGTADYLSPEQAMDPDKADIRSDIYSLGCTFYYLLTGRPPFPENNVMQKIIKHQRARPTPVQQLRPEVPSIVASTIQRMMAKKPEERQRTPAAVALALKPFCHVHGAESSRTEKKKSSHAAQKSSAATSSSSVMLCDDNDALMIFDSEFQPIVTDSSMAAGTERL